MIRLRLFWSVTARAAAPGLSHGGTGVEPAGAGQADLAEAAEVEDLGRGQRLVELHKHALEGLEVGDLLDRQADGRGRRQGVAGGADRDEADRGELGQAVELRDGTVDTDTIARTHGDSEVVVEDEDPLRGQRVGVSIGGRFLQVEATELVRDDLVVTDDDPVDRMALAEQRAEAPAPWMAWIAVDGSEQSSMLTTVNVNAWFDTIVSGGSLVS